MGRYARKNLYQIYYLDVLILYLIYLLEQPSKKEALL